jgi:hypothetical protein
MINYLGMLEDLIKTKSVQVSDGIVLKCADEINLSIFKHASMDAVVIKFHSPSVKVEISKMGPLNLINVLRPTVESITISKRSYKISIDNAPDIEVSRD